MKKMKNEERKMNKIMNKRSTRNYVVLLFSLFILLFTFACENPFIYDEAKNNNENGTEITIGDNGNWFINGEDTGVPVVPGGSSSVVATPVADPAPGFITANTEITLTCETVGAEIWYTLDGGNPMIALSRQEYTDPINLTDTTTIKAVAVKSGSGFSEILTAEYIVTKYPVVGDFDISGLVAYYSGSPVAVSITPLENKSNGNITVYYDGDTTPPSAIGSYAVTFDVAEDDGFFYAVTSLSAGNLVINPTYNPVVGDFNIEGLRQRYDGNPKTVTITPKENIPAGEITVFYNSSPTPPASVGLYAVTFNVAATESSNAAVGIYAGILDIDIPTPVVDDFDITGLAQDYDGNPKAVTITPKEGMSLGEITVYYEGKRDYLYGGEITNTYYDKSNIPPTNFGAYTVTFDIAKTTGFNAAINLSAGNLIITFTPTASDYNITGIGVFDYDGNKKTASITAKDYVPPTLDREGVRVYYNGTTTAPRLGGVYIVTFDVLEGRRKYLNVVTGLFAGIITINRCPVASDFEISGTGVFTYDGNPKTVTITPRIGMTTEIINIYYNGSTTAPTETGTYTVTFDVAASTGFNAVTGLNAGTIMIGNFDYIVYFNSNGGDNVDPVGVISGSTINAPLPPSKYDFIFENWYKDSNLTQVFSFGTGGDTITTNITLYAKWDFIYSLGDTGPGGGKVFYRSETGFIMTDTGERCHYLEVAPAGWYGTSSDPQEAWSEKLYDVNTGIEIGAGRKNTALINYGDTKQDFVLYETAAEACANYENNSKDDWFLPSIDELNELVHYWYYNDRSTGNSFGLSSNEFYFSSSQESTVFVWCIRPSMQSITGSSVMRKMGGSYAGYFFRPIRAF